MTRKSDSALNGDVYVFIRPAAMSVEYDERVDSPTIFYPLERYGADPTTPGSLEIAISRLRAAVATWLYFTAGQPIPLRRIDAYVDGALTAACLECDVRPPAPNDL